MVTRIWATSSIILLSAMNAHSQDSVSPPGPLDPKSVGADPKAGRPEVEALMAKVKAAFDPVNAMSYRAFSNAYAKIPGKSGAGPDGRFVRKHVFDVELAKADTGAWKFAVTLVDDQVGQRTPPDADEPAHASRVTFDSLTLRALRDDQKSVFERTVSTNGLGDIADFESFLDQHGASMTVPWDFLEDKNALGNAGRAAGAYVDRDDTVDSEACSVLRVMDMPGVFVPDAFKDEIGTRYKLSKKTSLPLLIERVRPGKEPGTFEISRSFVLKQFKTNADALSGDYTIGVPDGYRVRASQRLNIATKPEKPTSPGEGKKDPSGKTGPQKSGGPAPFAVAVGSPAPDFSLKTPDGKTKTLADYKGKIVLMDFWGTWCPPCRQAMPGVQKLYAKYKDKGVAVVGMDMEHSKDADPAKYMKDHGFEYELLLNAETVAPQYKITAVPTFFLLNKDGKILWSASGYSPQNEEQLDKLIAENLR